MTELYQARPFLTALAQRLADGGIESPRRDANLLVQMALGLEATILSHHELSFDARASDALEALIARRLEGCPISRLRGYREFYSLLFHLNEDTLDPRPDSECLVDAAIAAIQTNQLISLTAQGLVVCYYLCWRIALMPQASALI